MSAVSGYTYVALPTQLKPLVDGLNATGLVTSVVGRGVKNSAGTDVAAILLLQYNPKLTPLMDKSSPSKILDGAAKGAKAFAPGTKATITSHVLGGNQVRLVQAGSLSTAVGYQRGGVLIEVMGPAKADVLKFMGAYLAASAKA